ncbi:MAG: response regulator [Chloroflexi bacterium]|nr:response regulator [Chloroflexota bacterium]
MTNKRVLIVEDDYDNTTLVRLLLERENFDVITAENGEKGIAVTQSEQPDLIVLDLDMPVMNGWRMIDELKKRKNTRDIPIVVVTAHLLPDERYKVVDAGCDGYVLKPFQVADLIAEIKRWV